MDRRNLQAYLWGTAYLLIIVLPVLLLIASPVPAKGGFWWDAGIALGFTGLIMLLMQFFITSRLRKPAAPFGMDVIYYFHRWLAYGLLLVVVAHPLLLTIANPAILTEFSADSLSWAVVSGILALALMILIAVTSVFRKALHLRYNLWRIAHLLSALLAAALAFAHLWTIDYYSAVAPVKIFWLLMAAALLVMVLVVRVVRPWLLVRKPWRVADIREEQGSCWTLALHPEGHKGLDFLPGQFVWLSLEHSLDARSPLLQPMLRLTLVVLSLLLVFAIFAIAGPRAAFLMSIGLGFGLVLEGLRFGFTGPWKRMVRERDGRGLLAQLFSIGLCAVVAFPLLASAPDELTGAHAPVGFAMVLGAFVFGATMQLVLGCGSGTLVNAGSGNLMSAVALLGFVAGSFLGTLHLDWWMGLGSLPVYSLQGLLGPIAGLWFTLIGLMLVAAVVLWRSAPGRRLPSGRLWLAATLVAGLAILNLIVAGQPWGVVYGLGLWGAKLSEAAGFEVAATTFWSAPAHAERLRQSLFTDVTSLTNIGIIAGAFVAMRWRRQPDPQATIHGPLGPLMFLAAGVVLGYSARMAFGCNVGAYFSGVATGSVHGWLWFAAAFAGSALALNIRPQVLARLHLASSDFPGRGAPA